MIYKLDQLGNKISFVPISDIATISGNEYTLSKTSNFRSIGTFNDLNFEQIPSYTDAGTLYSQVLVAYVVNLDDLLRYKCQDLMVILQTVAGEVKLWGTKDFPVRCRLTPGITTMQLEFTSSSPFPIVF